MEGGASQASRDASGGVDGVTYSLGRASIGVLEGTEPGLCGGNGQSLRLCAGRVWLRLASRVEEPHLGLGAGPSPAPSGYLVFTTGRLGAGQIFPKAIFWEPAWTGSVSPQGSFRQEDGLQGSHVSSFPSLQGRGVGSSQGVTSCLQGNFRRAEGVQVVTQILSFKEHQEPEVGFSLLGVELREGILQGKHRRSATRSL